MRLQVKVGNQYRIFRDIPANEFTLVTREGYRGRITLRAYDNPELVDEPEMATLRSWDAVLSNGNRLYGIGGLGCEPLRDRGYEFTGFVYTSINDLRGQDRPLTEEELAMEQDRQTVRAQVEQAERRFRASLEQRMLEIARRENSGLGAYTATTHTGNGSVTADVNTENILRTMEEAQQRFMNNPNRYAASSCYLGGSPVVVSPNTARQIEASREAVRQEPSTTPLTEYRGPSIAHAPEANRVGRFRMNTATLVAMLQKLIVHQYIDILDIRQVGELFEVTAYWVDFKVLKPNEEPPLYNIHVNGRKLVNKGIIKEDNHEPERTVIL